MSSTTATIVLNLSAAEVFTSTEFPAGASEADRTIRSTLKLTQSMSSSTTPKVDKPPISQKIAATTTIDLTAVQGAVMPSTATRSIDLTSAKIVAAIFRAKTTNTSAVNIAPGGSDPYPIFGTGNDIDLKPGMVVGVGFDGVATTLPAVSSTVKNITVTIAGSDSVEVILLAGT